MPSLIQDYRSKYPFETQGKTDEEIAAALVRSSPRLMADPEVARLFQNSMATRMMNDGVPFSPSQVFDAHMNEAQGRARVITSPQNPEPRIAFEPEDVNWGKGMANGWARGRLLGKQTQLMSLGLLQSGDKQLDRDDIEAITKVQKELASIPTSEEFREFQKAEGFWDSLGELVSSPVQITAEAISESLSGLWKTGVEGGYDADGNYIAGKIPASIGIGASSGAAIGLAGAAPGAAAGAITGAGVGAATGMGLTSYTLEATSTYLGAFADAGVDTTNVQALLNAINDPETRDKARSIAMRKGMVVGVFDGVTAGIAGRGRAILAGAKSVAKPIAPKLAASPISRSGVWTTEMGVQMAGGMAGEAVGSVAAGQKVHWPSVLLEGVAELGMGAIEISVGTVFKHGREGEFHGKDQQALGRMIKKRFDEGRTVKEITDYIQGSDYFFQAQEAGVSEQELKDSYKEFVDIVKNDPDSFEGKTAPEKDKSILRIAEWDKPEKGKYNEEPDTVHTFGGEDRFKEAREWVENNRDKVKKGRTLKSGGKYAVLQEELTEEEKSPTFSVEKMDELLDEETESVPVKEKKLPEIIGHEESTAKSNILIESLAKGEATVDADSKLQTPLSQAVAAASMWTKRNTVRIIEDLSNHEASQVRTQVARNKDTPAEILAKLAKDAEVSIRGNVATNPSTPASTLNELSQDENEVVAENASNTVEDIASDADDSGLEVPPESEDENVPFGRRRGSGKHKPQPQDELVGVSDVTVPPPSLSLQEMRAELSQVEQDISALPKQEKSKDLGETKGATPLADIAGSYRARKKNLTTAIAKAKINKEPKVVKELQEELKQVNDKLKSGESGPQKGEEVVVHGGKAKSRAKLQERAKHLRREIEELEAPLPEEINNKAAVEREIERLERRIPDETTAETFEQSFKERELSVQDHDTSLKKYGRLSYRIKVIEAAISKHRKLKGKVPPELEAELEILKMDKNDAHVSMSQESQIRELIEESKADSAKARGGILLPSFIKPSELEMELNMDRENWYWADENATSQDEVSPERTRWVERNPRRSEVTRPLPGSDKLVGFPSLLEVLQRNLISKAITHASKFKISIKNVDLAMEWASSAMQDARAELHKYYDEGGIDAAEKFMRSGILPFAAKKYVSAVRLHFAGVRTTGRMRVLDDIQSEEDTRTAVEKVMDSESFRESTDGTKASNSSDAISWEKSKKLLEGVYTTFFEKIRTLTLSDSMLRKTFDLKLLPDKDITAEALYRVINNILFDEAAKWSENIAFPIKKLYSLKKLLSEIRDKRYAFTRKIEEMTSTDIRRRVSIYKRVIRFPDIATRRVSRIPMHEGDIAAWEAENSPITDPKTGNKFGYANIAAGLKAGAVKPYRGHDGSGPIQEGKYEKIQIFETAFSKEEGKITNHLVRKWREIDNELYKLQSEKLERESYNESLTPEQENWLNELTISHRSLEARLVREGRMEITKEDQYTQEVVKLYKQEWKLADRERGLVQRYDQVYHELHKQKASKRWDTGRLAKRIKNATNAHNKERARQDQERLDKGEGPDYSMYGALDATEAVKQFLPEWKGLGIAKASIWTPETLKVLLGNVRDGLYEAMVQATAHHDISLSDIDQKESFREVLREVGPMHSAPKLSPDTGTNKKDYTKRFGYRRIPKPPLPIVAYPKVVSEFLNGMKSGSMSVQDAVSRLLKSVPELAKTPMAKLYNHVLIKFLPKADDDNAIRVHAMKFRDPRHVGVYFDNNIVLDITAEDPREMFSYLMEEIMHSLTVGRINEGIANGKGWVEMDKVFESVKRHASSVKFRFKDGTVEDAASAFEYELGDIKEFVARAFSNAEFQAFLMTIPYESEQGVLSNLWEEFINAVKSIFGMDVGNTTAFDEIITQTSFELAAETTPTDMGQQRIADWLRDGRLQRYDREVVPLKGTKYPLSDLAYDRAIESMAIVDETQPTVADTMNKPARDLSNLISEIEFLPEKGDTISQQKAKEAKLEVARQGMIKNLPEVLFNMVIAGRLMSSEAAKQVGKISDPVQKKAFIKQEVLRFLKKNKPGNIIATLEVIREDLKGMDEGTSPPSFAESKGKPTPLTPAELLESAHAVSEVPTEPEPTHGWWDRFYQKFITKSHFAQLMEDRIHETSSYDGIPMLGTRESHELLNGAPQKAYHLISRFNKAIGDLIGRGQEKNFNTYLFLQRTRARLLKQFTMEERLKELEGRIENSVMQNKEDELSLDEKLELITLTVASKAVGTWTVEQADAALTEMMKDIGSDRYGKFKAAQKKYSEFTEESLFSLVEAGRVRLETYLKIIDSGEFYAPFYVVQYFDATQGNLLEYVRGIKSEDFNVIPLMDATRYKLYNTMMVGEYNKFGIQMGELAKFDDSQSVIMPFVEEEKRSSDVEASNAMNMEKIRKKEIAMGKARAKGNKTRENLLMEEISEIRRRLQKHRDVAVPDGWKKIEVWKNGVKNLYIMRSEYHDVMNMKIPPVREGALGAITSVVTDVFKMGATGLNLFFQTFNFLLVDPMRTLTSSRAGLRMNDAKTFGANFILQYFRGFAASMWANVPITRGMIDRMPLGVFSGSEKLVTGFIESGAAGSTISDYLERGRVRNPATAKKKRGWRGSLDSVFGWMNKGQSFLNTTGKVLEHTAKLVGFQRMIDLEEVEMLQVKIDAEENLEKQLELEDELASKMKSLAIEIRNYIGSPDFARMGTATEAMGLNLVFMFFNARVQGVERDFNRLAGIFRKGDRGEAMKMALRLTAMAAVPSVLVWSMNRRKDYDDDYDKISPEDKKHYIHIPMESFFTHPWTGEKVREYIRIPRRETFGMVSYLTEGMLDYMVDQDPKAVEEMVSGLIEGIVPVNIQSKSGGLDLDPMGRFESVMSSLNPVIKTPFEIASNRNYYHHSQIVRPELEAAPSNQQYYNNTPIRYRQIAKILGGSPLLVQHGIRGMTAGLFDQFIPEADSSDRPKLMQKVPIAKRLFRSKYLAPTDNMIEMEKLGEGEAARAAERNRIVDSFWRESKDMVPRDRARFALDMLKEMKQGHNTLLVKNALVKKFRELNLSREELMLKSQLGVVPRAQYIISAMMKLPVDERREYWLNLYNKRIITRDVARSIVQEMRPFGGTQVLLPSQ